MTREDILTKWGTERTKTVTVGGDEFKIKGLSSDATANHMMAGYGEGTVDNAFLMIHAPDIVILGCVDPKFEPTDKEVLSKRPDLAVELAGEIISLTFQEGDEAPNS